MFRPVKLLKILVAKPLAASLVVVMGACGSAAPAAATASTAPTTATEPELSEPPALPASADPSLDARAPTPFDRGKVGVSLGAGTQATLGARRISIGGGVGYYIVDGLQLGLSTAFSFGTGPNITRVSPALTYVAQPLVSVWPVVPYVGTFYKHWFIGDGYDDADSLGSRLGLYFLSGHLVLGLGIAFEHLVSACTVDCNTIYPDLSFGFAL